MTPPVKKKEVDKENNPSSAPTLRAVHLPLTAIREFLALLDCHEGTF
jgi:hypothetical protein